MNTFESPFAIGEAIYIDGDISLKAIILAHAFRAGNHTLDVAWFHNGEAKSTWIEEWRLTKVTP